MDFSAWNNFAIYLQIFLYFLRLYVEGHVCPRCFCCANGSDCRETDGLCYGNCMQGYFGSFCNQHCGYNCLECDKYSGCTLCKEGHHGDTCDLCKEGYYPMGKECLKCPGNCITCLSFEKCHSCMDGMFGNSCQYNCSACINGDCDVKSPSCQCHLKFSGTLCDTCSSGFYGDKCENNCSFGCLNTCDSKTGECLCNQHFSGKKCDECASGYFGISCGSKCLKSCATCLESNTCTTCLPGRYGDACQMSCSFGCVNNTCTADGMCACKQNFTGENCDTCISGHYGLSCNLSCSAYCINCSSLQECHSCETGFFVKNGTCLKVNVPDAKPLSEEGHSVNVIVICSLVAIFVISIIVGLTFFCVKQRGKIYLHPAGPPRGIKIDDIISIYNISSDVGKSSEIEFHQDDGYSTLDKKHLDSK
ncbi:multiple epidermal growth factor-like domains protein 10 [Mya arenaria]|uniref:multiple epidermal growth factor-like domains protein 10 n=1 Tax=Mya arenaria TaxID=6604 RepID=UPI0022DF2FA9|nr:multiple epidermal growth factor-like domains protein 10 [Mya arenaria]